VASDADFPCACFGCGCGVLFVGVCLAAAVWVVRWAIQYQW